MSVPLREQVRFAEVTEVIRVVTLRGHGERGSPMREVTAYYLPDGTFIGEHDPCGGAA